MSKNYGFINVPPRETDYLAGVGNGIKYNINLESRDWTPYRSRGEWQSGIYFDTFGCVSFSAANIIEMILNYRIEKGEIHEDDLNWLVEKGYFNKSGKLNFSDRFTAKMSGTTPKGNWFYKVGDSVRKDGLIPETKWAYPREQQKPVFTRNDYYKEIPQELKDLGKEFLTRFSIKYEWVYKDFVNELIHGPLQVSVFAWGTPINGVYQRTTRQLNDAVVLTARKKYRIVESAYEPFQKKLADDFILGKAAMRYIVTSKLPTNKKDMQELFKAKDKSSVYMLGVDGLYHPIANENFVIKLFGTWDEVKVTELVGINSSKIGSTIGEFSWMMARINDLFKK